MKISPFLKQTISILACTVLLTACGDSGNSGTNTSSNGALTLRVTDAPVDTAEHVYIQFRGLELQSADGARTSLYYCPDSADASKTVVSTTACSSLAAPKQIDLLRLTGGEADFLLNGYMLPAGHYNWIRLMVGTAGTHDSYIVLLGGADHELTIPSSDQTGLKLNRGFDVPTGGSADFTIDFDLRKSVHVTGTGEYMLRPTLRVADNAMTGSITGTVDPSLIPSGCTPAVYVFTGTGITPNDINIDSNTPGPVTTASVKLDISDGVYKYKAAFLEAGSYTIAFTCDTATDDPSIDDTLVFAGATTVSVTANTSTTHDF